MPLSSQSPSSNLKKQLTATIRVGPIPDGRSHVPQQHYLTCPLQNRSPQSSIGCQVGCCVLSTVFTHLCVVSSPATGVEWVVGWTTDKSVFDTRQGRNLVQRPHWLWEPPRLSSGYMGLSSRGQSNWSVKLVIYFHLCRKLGNNGDIHLLPHTSCWRAFSLLREHNRKINLYRVNVSLSVNLIIAYFLFN